MAEDPTGGEGATIIRDRMRNAPGLHLGHAIALLIATESVLIGVVVAVLTPRSSLPWTLLAVLAIGPASLALAGAAMRLALWGPWQRRFPPRPQSPDAVVKPCQSVRLGWCWINNAVHIAADDSAMHLIPLWFLRAGGCAVLSIPWDEFGEVEPLKGRQDVQQTAIGGRLFAGPAWAMRLARPTPRGTSEPVAT